MDKFFAALGLLACALVVAHMAMGPVRRARLAAASQQAWANTKARWARRHLRPKVGPGADSATTRREAQREAQQLIDRARRRGVESQRDGNVIRPRAFDAERKKPPLH